MLFDPMLAGIILEKLARFGVGILITIGAIGVGVWHGRRLKAQGITGENYFERNKIDKVVILRLVITLTVIVGGGIWLDRKFMFFSSFGPYAQETSLITLRSLILFLFAVQWQIWEDKTRLKRTLWLLALALMIGVAVEAFVLCPAALLVGHEVNKDGTVIQSTPTTCGAAAMANLLRLYGRPATEFECAVNMRIGMNGTTDAEAVTGARIFGFPDAAPWRPTLDQIASDDLPLMISIYSCGVKHFVVVAGITPTQVIILDPYVGIVQYLRKYFREMWDEEGVRFGLPSFPCSGPVRLTNFDVEAFQKTSFSFEAGRKSTGNEGKNFLSQFR